MSLSPHEFASPLLRLPPETRLHIYSCFIPSNILHIDLCTPLRLKPTANRPTGLLQRPTIMSTLVQQMQTLNTITHTNGLHLLLVCRLLRTEMLHLLLQTTTHFHCPECFKLILKNLTHGMGPGIGWMTHVQIALDLTDTRQVRFGQRMTVELAKTMAREAMQGCQKTGWLFFGRLDLMGREAWAVEAVREEEGEEVGVDGTRMGGLQQVVPVQGPGYHGAMMHAMSNAAVKEVPTKWIITGNFDLGRRANQW